MKKVISKDDCFMLAKDPFGAYFCSGRIDHSICGMDCPFRKTEWDQRYIEQKIVDHLKRINSLLVYKSRLTGEVLYNGKKEAFYGW